MQREVSGMKVDRPANRRSATVLAICVLGGLLATAPSAAQTAEPSIALLNPSSFAAAGERGIIVSDTRPDAGPGCCDLADDFYRLSAWVSGQPEGSTVFFTVRQSALEFEIESNEETPGGSWIAEWSIPPELLDGPATISAFLIQGESVLASTSRQVTIMRTQDNIDLTWPRTGERFGTYAPLATEMPAEGAAERKAPVGVVDALWTNSPQITYVRAFYTTSLPGEDPKWEICGTETVGSTAAGNGVRCTVAPDDREAITAVAAVSNDSPDEYDARFNGSGDAIPFAENYIATPTSLGLGRAVFQKVGREPTSQKFFCSDNQEVRLTDQIGRAVPGANVDVHAAGPSDGLAFHTFTVLTVNQPPDRGDHTLETAFDCTGQSAALPPANANPAQQGEHQRFGLPDRKHIETRSGGTNDLGIFTFRLHSNAQGETRYTAWVDEFDDGCLANDDRFTVGELAVSGTIGWATDAGPAEFPLGESVIPCSPDGGPLPDPSPTEPSGSRTINLWTGAGRVTSGDRIGLKGRIKAEDGGCASLQHVKLKVRRPGGTFRAADETVSGQDGRYRFRVTVRGDRDYRTIAIPRGFCEKVRSRLVRIRPG